jgi:hypothetical protein
LAFVGYSTFSCTFWLYNPRGTITTRKKGCPNWRTHLFLPNISEWRVLFVIVFSINSLTGIGKCSMIKSVTSEAVMPICGYPTKSGTPCKRVSPYCWQHGVRWRIGGAALAVMTVVSFLSIFVETPRIKFGSVENISKGLPAVPTNVKAVVSDEPSQPSITPSDRILTADSATAKTGHPSTKVIHPMPAPTLNAVVQ